MTRSYLVTGVRTPIGRFQGGLSGLRAVDLGAVAIRAALERAGLAPDAVEYTIMGHVLQAGQGQITARQAAVAAGIPIDVPAITINKVCPSGMAAIAMADQMIRAGEIEVAVAGGMESMSNAPFVLPRARDGQRLGHTPMLDVMIHDGLWCAFDDQHMGVGTDEMNREYGVDRPAQDAWAARSHLRAAAAWDEGRFDREVVPVSVPQRKGEPVDARARRGHPGRHDRHGAGGPPAGVHGRGHGHGGQRLADQRRSLRGGRRRAKTRSRRLGLVPLARIEAYGMSADRFPSLHTVPALAMDRALKKVGVGAADLGVLEVNEAFAGVAVHTARMLDVDEALVNPNGGAVALGHPIGASGARIVLTTAFEMQRRDAELGGAAICGGGGQGDALVLRRV